MNKKGLHLVGLLVLLLTACVHDSYEDCPKEGSIEIAMTYYKHNKGNYDRFPSEVTRAEYFFFSTDSLKLVHREVAESGVAPFPANYKRTFRLPGGDYRVLSWCNGGTAWKANEMVPGVTTLDEARMMLSAAPTQGGGHAVTTMPESLFFGETQQKTIHVKNGKTVRDSIDLMKVTHDIHLRIRWKDHDGFYCTYKGHEDVTKAYIELKNGEYDFGCEMQYDRSLTYFPTYLPGEEETPIDYASVRADYRVGRLMAEGSTAKIVLAEQMPDGTLQRRYTASLVDLIRLTGQYDTQTQIDHEDTFDVDIDLCCIDPTHTHANTWMVLGIRINGWVVSNIEAEF